jgi:cell division protein FtsB
MADRRRLVKRAAVALVAAVALWFAVEGGEFGTRDLIRNMRDANQLTRATDSLQRVVDSLKRYKFQLERDTALQERIAREQFGMLRGKELMYRFTDSVVKR